MTLPTYPAADVPEPGAAEPSVSATSAHQTLPLDPLDENPVQPDPRPDGGADVYPLTEAGPELEATDPGGPGDPFHELREELSAAGVESRRTARRQMEVFKEFGAAITSIGRLVHDLHSTSRAEAVKAAAAPSAPAAETTALHLPLIEMADRLARAAEAFRTPPATAAPFWWPIPRAATGPWQAAWESQKDALFILCSHMDALLARAGLERIPAAGAVFDPATMSAVEVVTDSSRPDHTVVAELLSGWRAVSSGRTVRPTQVRVSRLV